MRVAYWVKVYRANLGVAWALMAQYRFAMVIWAVWGFVGPLVSLAVWNAALHSGSGAISNQGVSFQAGDFSAYFLVFMIFSHFTMSWDAEEFSYRVRTGRLSPQLLRPLHPIHADASYNIAFKALTTVLVLPAWLLLFWLLRPTLPSSPMHLVLAVPALLLAGVTRYLWQYALAVVAFWTTRVDAINQLYFVLDAFLSGRIAPIALLPAWIAALSRVTPFYAMGALPVEIALGRVPIIESLYGMAMQSVWLVIGLLVFRIAWRAGVRQYSAVGA